MELGALWKLFTGSNARSLQYVALIILEHNIFIKKCKTEWFWLKSLTFPAGSIGHEVSKVLVLTAWMPRPWVRVPLKAWMFVFELCRPVYVEAVFRADPPSNESYQLSKWFIITEVIMNWNRSQDLIHTSEGRKVFRLWRKYMEPAAPETTRYWSAQRNTVGCFYTITVHRPRVDPCEV
jgi:hypothetical protein